MKKEIVIEVKNGAIHNVYSLNKELNIVVVDYDGEKTTDLHTGEKACTYKMPPTFKNPKNFFSDHKNSF